MKKRELYKLAITYRKERSPDESMKSEIRKLYEHFIKGREQLLLEIAATVVAMNSLIDLVNEVDYDKITPQMKEAFNLAFPNKDLESLDAEELSGMLNAWKGKYFEVLVRDELNAGEAIGDIQLEPGQTAVLAESPTQPDWDLQIINEDGTVDEQLQLKATDSLSYVKSAITENPDIDVIATEEVFANPDLVVEQMQNSGISNAELEEIIESPFTNSVSDYVLPFSSFVLITLNEGTKMLMGKQSFQYAISNSLDKMVKSGISIGAGSFAYMLTDMGIISIPTTIATRIGLDRVELMKKMNGMLKERMERIRELRMYIY